MRPAGCRSAPVDAGVASLSEDALDNFGVEDLGEIVVDEIESLFGGRVHGESIERRLGGWKEVGLSTWQESVWRLYAALAQFVSIAKTQSYMILTHPTIIGRVGRNGAVTWAVSSPAFKREGIKAPIAYLGSSRSVLDQHFAGRHRHLASVFFDTFPPRDAMFRQL